MRCLFHVLNVVFFVVLFPSTATSINVLPAKKTDDVNESEKSSATQESQKDKIEPELDIGGALRLLYAYRGWDGQEANQKRAGDFSFSMFRINVDGGYGNLKLVMAYRFYLTYHMLERGWIGYDIPDTFRVSLGVCDVPFGILPYASHSWFFGLPYFMGLEADSDLGVVANVTPGNFSIHVGFFKNDEGSYGGSSRDSARYSFDFVNATGVKLGEGSEMVYDHQETNQVNGRVAYEFDHSTIGSTEIGASGQYGGIFNGETNELGYHWAAAGHFDGNYVGFQVQLEGVVYDYKPAYSEGQADSFVVMGGHDAPLKVAGKGYLFVGNIAYKLKLDFKYFSSITFYGDFSMLNKKRAGFEDSYQIMPGLLIVTGPVVTQIEVGIARNHPWIGPYFVDALARGGSGSEWAYRPNINISFYF